jgi:predicted RNA-binding Zn ribbon-like protein
MQTAARMQPLKDKPPAVPARRFQLLGGRIAVDFANAVRSSDSHRGAVDDWPGLVAFLEQVGVISPQRTNELLRMADADAQAVEQLLDKALALRGALRQGFEKLIRGEHIERSDVEVVNDFLRVTEGHDELVPEGREWRLRLIARQERPEWLLAAVARSAAELLAEGPAAPLRKCANARCPLFFYDTSRTGKRRWCSMSACGNRSKVAAFARRQGRSQRSA